MGFCGPRAQVQVGRPVLRWEVWSDKGSVSAVKMTLNGKEVAASYDSVRRAVLFRPQTSLADGDYRVDCSVTFAGDWVFKKSWDLSIRAKAALSDADEPQQAALAAANRYRVTLGLPPFTFEPRMAAASTCHAKYLSANRLRGHGQRSGDPGYVASSPTERLEAFGWAGGNYEGIAYDTTSSEEAIRGLFEAPYHRIPFLQPGPIEVGIGLADRRVTMNFESTRTEAVQVSPGENEKDVPPSWICHEEPNPLRVHPDLPTMVGFPITIAAFGPTSLRLTSASVSLTDGQGEPVAFRLNTPSNDSHLDNAAIVIPARPLRPASRYHVVFEGETSLGKKIHRDWWFTTATR